MERRLIALRSNFQAQFEFAKCFNFVFISQTLQKVELFFYFLVFFTTAVKLSANSFYFAVNCWKPTVDFPGTLRINPLGIWKWSFD